MNPIVINNHNPETKRIKENLPQHIFRFAILLCRTAKDWKIPSQFINGVIKILESIKTFKKGRVEKEIKFYDPTFPQGGRDKTLKNQLKYSEFSSLVSQPIHSFIHVDTLFDV